MFLVKKKRSNIDSGKPFFHTLSFRLFHIVFITWDYILHSRLAQIKINHFGSEIMAKITIFLTLFLSQLALINCIYFQLHDTRQKCLIEDLPKHEVRESFSSNLPLNSLSIEITPGCPCPIQRHGWLLSSDS